MGNEDKFRRVPMHNKNFSLHVGQAPGGVELLQAVGYVDHGPYMVLRTVDVSRISRAKVALGGARNSSQYRDAKEAQQLVSALQQSRIDFEAHESRRKSDLAKLVPDEPPEGAAGSVGLCFHLDDQGVTRKIWRRFESHDTLQDLYNYVGSLRQLGSDKWQLLNITMSRAEPTLLAPERKGVTLQNLDLWPVGHVLVKAC